MRSVATGWSETAPRANATSSPAIRSSVATATSGSGMAPTKRWTTPSLRVQPSVRVRRKSPPINDDGCLAGLLMQNVGAAFGKPVTCGSCVELHDLGFQVLVDQQQCLQCTAQITVAACHDLVDDSFTWSRSHR